MGNDYSVTIIGGGVSGTSLLYTLSSYTDQDDLLLLEKDDQLAPLNSDSASNSQTLHAGDIETNYSRDKSEHVKEAADMVVAYTDDIADRDDIAHSLPKMVLGVGQDEVEQLEQRYDDLHDLYPELEKLDREEIREKEPALVEDRDPDQELLALHSEDGHAVDYGALSRSFADQAEQRGAEIQLDTPVDDIIEREDRYKILTDNGSYTSDTIAVTAGPYSLDIAQELGYGEEYAQLPVAGGFYFGADDLQLDSKVYTVQNDKLPFAAVHGDPDIDEGGRIRFGPTAMPLLSREWDKQRLPDFIHPANIETDVIRDLLDTDVIKTLGSQLADPDVARFMAKNLAYELPGGKHAFLQDARKIIPSLEPSDLEQATDKGGVRPQIIDREANELLLGEAKIEGDDILFNMTPSPGATNCLGNAAEDAQTIIDFLEGDFDREQFQDDHSRD
jgi:malate dehydrogenase (quinone)